MAEKKTTAAEPAAKKKPSSAALKAAVAQLEEEETGKKKNTVLMRVGAFVLWALAAVAMYLPDIGKDLPFGAIRVLMLNNVTACIIDIIVAGVLCVLAALLWKKANHIHPTKSHNQLVQLLWNQLGVVMACVILAPLGIYMIAKSDKIDADTKKKVGAVLAAVFIAASAGSADYHPVTQDEVDEILQEADENGYTGDTYWTKYGHSYHYSLECQSLRNSKRENIYSGTLEEALAANRTDACDFCAQGGLEKAAVEQAAEELPEALEEAEEAAG